MTILIDDNLLVIWYASITSKQDFLGAVSKAGNDYKFQYRFRYYSPKSKEPFDEEDKKHWYEGVLSGDRHTEEEVLTKIRGGLALMLAHRPPGAEPLVLNELLRGESESADHFAERLSKQPWAFAKKIALQ